LTGSTTSAFWSPSATFRQPKPRSDTTPCWTSQPWPHNLNQKASGKPGAVQWLSNELRIIKPKIVVALGATAASFLVGNSVRITKDRGTIFHPDNGTAVLVTVHPSYILRVREKSAAEKEKAKLVEDLMLLHQYEE
jgi:uracil-DNA glycosylase family 4